MSNGLYDLICRMTKVAQHNGSVDMKHLFSTIAVAALVLAGCQDKASAPEAKQHSGAKTETQAPANPALWVVEDADTKVYLFGTLPVLTPETQWLTPKIEKAILSADAIYDETDLSPEVEQQLESILPGLAFYSNGCNLKCDLDDDEEQEVYAMAAELGLPEASMDAMLPWFADVAISQMYVVKQGYSIDSGVDREIAKMAKDADIPMRFFETPEQQIRFFSDIPIKDQVSFLMATVESIKDDPDMLDETVAEWAEGDVDAIAQLMASDNVMGSDSVIDVQLTQRNQNWVEQIDDLLDAEAGSFFVAVGAEHLAGPDSVIELLREKGETVTRQ